MDDQQMPEHRHTDVEPIIPVNPAEVSEYWSSRYRTGQMGWDLGGVSPPLKHCIDVWKSEAKEGRAVLLPGCGNAYEANYLLDQEFQNVTVVDIAEPALESIRQRLSQQSPEHLKHIHLLHSDFFQVQGTFDLVLEQTFFCALNPSLRPEYARKMHSLLGPEGELAGVFFDAPMYDHRPPFGGSAEEYRDLLEPYFDFLTWESCQVSHPGRQGTELLFRIRKRS